MLEGKIGEFSLPDIFQLIALTKKSGALNLSSSQADGRILFKGGEICFAVADVARVAIGARLVQAGLASEEQVLGILERQRADGATGNLSQALLEGADVDEGALDAFIRSSIEDAVFDLMRLTEATFSFDATDEPDTTVGLTVSTEHLIIEGGRRMGEWASIREHIPSSDAVPAVSPAAAGDGQVSLTGEQWRVLALVDGKRTVRELVDLTGQGEFTTAQLLSGMVTQGMVEVIGADDAGALAELYARRDKLRRIEELELGGTPPRLAVKPAPAPVKAKAPAPEPEVVAPAPVIESPKVEVEPEPEPEAEPPAEPPAPAPEPELVASAEVAALMDDLIAEDIAGSDGATSPAPAPVVEEIDVLGNGNGDAAKANASPEPVDRAQVARELASLGLGDDAPAAGPTRVVPAPGAPTEEIRRLTRDEDVNKGLLLRLIDGVKGA